MNHADQTERPPPRLRNHVFVTMLENRGTKLGLLDLMGEEQRGSKSEGNKQKERKKKFLLFTVPIQEFCPLVGEEERAPC